MPHLGNRQTPVANVGGGHLQHDTLAFNPPTSIRNNEPHSAGTTPQKASPHAGGNGSGLSTSDEASNEEEDEDSSGEKDGETEEPEVVAPSHGIGLGKGKRPSIRIDPAGDGESQEEVEDISSREMGHPSSSNAVNPFLMRNKKRTYSNVSSNSVLYGDEDDRTSEQAVFPRRKLARRLSTNTAMGLLTYLKDPEIENIDRPAKAVESSGDEKPVNTVDVDDEDYSGVNLISDESDLEEMEKQEEEWLINDAQQSADLFSDARRLSLDSSASDNYYPPGIPLSEDFFATTNEFPDVGFGQFFEPDPSPTSPGPGISRKYSDSSTKRVRFDDEVNMSDSSSTSSSELDTSLWPDLFEKDKLPVNIYQMIENDHDVDMDGDFPSSGSEHSFWDFGQEDNGSRFQDDSGEYDDSESEAGSSGYETDMGDTTDECDSEASPPPRSPQQKSVLRRPSSAPGSRAATPKPYQRSTRSGTGKFLPPVCGVFIHGDRNKAIAVTNRTTKTVAFYRPRTGVTFRRSNFEAAATSATSTAQNSPRTNLQHLGTDDNDFHDAFTSPFNNSTDIMFTGIFGAAPDSDILALLNGSSVGPPEAFYPFVSVNQNGTYTIMSDEDGLLDEEAEISEDINLEDFMDFGPEGDETDVEQEDSTDTPATPATSMVALPSSTPAQPTPNEMTPSNRKRTASNVMLEHFDRGVVTAFRNNQYHYRSLARLPHDPDLRASVSRPIRSGRSAETLMSPLRKRSVITKKMNGTVLAGISKATGKPSSRAMHSQHGPRAGTFS